MNSQLPPRRSARKTAPLQVFFRPEDYAAIKEAARLEGYTLAHWCRLNLLAAAQAPILLAPMLERQRARSKALAQRERGREPTLAERDPTVPG